MLSLERLRSQAWWFIDLSLTLRENSGELIPVSIQRTAHKEGIGKLGERLVSLGLLSPERRLTESDLPDREFLSNEELRLSVHSGTHLDAPFHFGSQSEGAASMTIEEVPLEWCFGPGVVLDVSHRGPGEEITAEDVQQSLRRLAEPPRAGDIVLLRTGADRYWGTAEYATAHPGVSIAALSLLLDGGARIIGIDAAGFDRPTHAMVRDYSETGDAGRLWPAHFYGRRRSYCHIERLCNLDKLPVPQGFFIACFPVKIERAGAGWVRAVAMGPSS
jgi:kynurenine formamidase